MATADPDLARSRFIGALRRIRAGLELQRSRIVGNVDAAPRMFEGTPYEVTDLSGVPTNDLDYYVFELGRLREAGRAIIKAFGKPAEIVEAAEEFKQAIPRMWETRNPLTHPSDDSRLDDVAWFSGLVELKAGGSVEYLVDPRYSHHNAALKFADAMLVYLRAGVCDSIAGGLSPAE